MSDKMTLGEYLGFHGEHGYLTPLIEDCIIDASDLSEVDQQHRRGYIRAIFACVEAQTCCLKRRIVKELLAKSYKDRKFNLSKLALLCDDLPTVDQTGKIKSSGRYLPFKGNTAFTIRTLAEIRGCSDTDVFIDNGWNELLKASKVRDRIIHPKDENDIFITDDEVESTTKGFFWYMKTVCEFLTVEVSEG